MKVLFPALAANESTRLMFADEVKIARRLIHPNIVRHHFADRLGGLEVLAMEYVFGADLARFQRAAARVGHPISLPVLLSMTSSLLDALHYAHELRDPNGAPLNLVHRDVTPRNLLVGFDGVPKLIDFGAAKTTGRSWETESGLIVGSFSYSSPEQLMGKKLDRRSDIFSLGVVLWEALTGRALFGGASLGEVVDKMRAFDVPAPSTVAISPMPGMIEVDRIVLRALDRSPRGRYETAAAMRDDVEIALQELGEQPTEADIAAEMRAVFGKEMGKLEVALGAALKQRAGIQDLGQLLGCARANEGQIRGLMRSEF